jgi:2-aminoadipate transaminase
MLSLAGGLPSPALFPRRVIAAATLSVLQSPSCAALQYGWPEGQPELREWVARRLAGRGLGSVRANDVVITSGAQQAIQLAVEVLFTNGGAIAVDAETYPAALDSFHEKGILPTTSLDAHAAYLMPWIGNPSGRATDGERVRELRRARLPVIADEAYSELRFDGQPKANEALGGNVFRIGTFSKTLCPGFRIGWLVPPPSHRKRVLAAKAAADLQANSLSQSILSTALTRFDYDEHLVRIRKSYARRADRLLTAVRKHLPFAMPEEPEGGFSVFVRTDTEGDELRLLRMAIREGTSFDPGRSFRATGGRAPMSFRLCHSNTEPRALEEAVRRLARAWKAARSA